MHGHRTTRVRTHTRTSATGKAVRVRSHSRTMSEWRKAGVAWLGAAGSGATTLALVVEAGFALVSVAALLLTLVLSLVAGVLTEKASASKRKMRAKVRAKVRSTLPRVGTAKTARRRR